MLVLSEKAGFSVGVGIYREHHSSAGAALHEVTQAPWLYFSPLLLVAGGSWFLATSATTWIGLLLFISGTWLFLAGLVAVLTATDMWHLPAWLLRMRGEHPDQHQRAPEASRARPHDPEPSAWFITAASAAAPR